jgi:hypothetical protein
MDDDWKVWAGVAILLIVAIWLMSQRTVTTSSFEPEAPSVTVYGSETCPWCVKQKEYLDGKGMKYDFVDCASGQCPDFVDGFPTLKVNGEIKRGYTEL